MKTCKNCGQPIERTATNGHVLKFCTNRCRTAYHNKRNIYRQPVVRDEYHRFMPDDVRASRALIVERLGFAPPGDCADCPLLRPCRVCVGSGGAALCELDDSQAGINTLRIPVDAWLGMTAMPLRDERDPLSGLWGEEQ
jgi:hypothetical protein